MALSSIERAAVLLMSLGESEAAEVMKYLEPKEVQQLGTAMTRLDKVTQPQVHQVMGDFIGEVKDVTAFGVEAEDYVRGVLERALGEDKAESMIDRILHASDTTGLDMLKWMDPHSIAEVLRLEHPQIIAIVLSYLDRGHASEIMSALPQPIAVDVSMRIASLDGVPSAALKELSLVMEKTFTGKGAQKSSAAKGGLKAVAEIVNLLDASTASELLTQVKERDAEMGEGIEGLLFVFDDLSDVDSRGMQSLMREVSSEVLVIALKGSDPELQAHFFSNMSSRAAEMMKEDLEARGPVKLSEVEASQKEILTVVRRLMDSGDIVLGGGGDEYV